MTIFDALRTRWYVALRQLLQNRWYARFGPYVYRKAPFTRYNQLSNLQPGKSLHTRCNRLLNRLYRDSRLSNRLYNPFWQPVERTAVRSTRLSNRFDNWLDVFISSVGPVNYLIRLQLSCKMTQRSSSSSMEGERVQYWTISHRQQRTVESRESCAVTVIGTSGYATMVQGRGCNPHRCTTTFANLEIT